ncbi:MAG: hypothetical protein HKO65_03165 [Gemmatimonadetes bacterium]|nr:hypothetical protein [Gemmatimonadota bacterium]NNM04078.1 hypothetical protein [Gemmatimonadota bacterium]
MRQTLSAQAKSTDRALELVLDRLGWIRDFGIWPHGPRDLWTDALGVICLTSIHHTLKEDWVLAEAEWVAQEVDRVLGRRKGIRTAEKVDGEGQTFRSLALWVFALHRLGRVLPQYRHRALALVREIHAPFVRPGAGIIPRMEEDLSRPFRGSGPGLLEVFLGLAVYRQVGEDALRPEIEELEGMVLKSYKSLAPDHGVDLGLLLWITHFFPEEGWALALRERTLAAMDGRWVDPPGYFRRNLPEPWDGPVRSNRLALSNFGASIGLQAQGVWDSRVKRLHRYFLEDYRWETDMDDALAPILLCISLRPGLFLSEKEASGLSSEALSL